MNRVGAKRRQFCRFLPSPFVAVVYLFSAFPTAWAQPVSIGVKGGIHLLDWFKPLNGGPSGEATDESSKAAVGPFVSARLSESLAMQFEGLRRGYGFKRSTARLGSFNSHEESGSGWEIPALLVWRPDYEENGWRPYASAGPALRYVTAAWTEISRRPQLFPTDPPARETRTPGHRSQSNIGAIAAAGMEREVGRVAISIELRYARWTGATLLGDIVPNRNQVSILFGVRSR
jgi:hypothetical protein